MRAPATGGLAPGVAWTSRWCLLKRLFTPCSDLALNFPCETSAPMGRSGPPRPQPEAIATIATESAIRKEK